MTGRTPLTILTGPLGSGKTTLLRHILAVTSSKIAILMNEFGEIAIDTKILQGKNVEIADLGGGCVCCSLLGEFEVAVDEIIETVNPDWIVVETTGVAEPEALVFEVQESLPNVRLDAVVTVVDADALVKYPRLGHTTEMQVEVADILLLNKLDLVPADQVESMMHRLRSLNEVASIIPTQHCQVDPALLFGMARTRTQPTPHHTHQPEFDSFSYISPAIYDFDRFEAFASQLNPDIYRAKGFIQFPDGTYLFNYVAGRWDLEPFEAITTELVFIGKSVNAQRSQILSALQACEQS